MAADERKELDEETIRKRKKVKKTIKRIVWIAIILGVIAILVVMNNLKPAEKKEVKTSTISKRDISTTVSAAGTIKAKDSFNVTGNLLGMKVKSICVSEGQQVSKGDVICIFDTTELEKQLSDAKSNLSTTRREVEDNRKQINDAAKTTRDNQISELERQLADLKRRRDEANTVENINTVSNDIETNTTNSVIENIITNPVSYDTQIERLESQIDSLRAQDTNVVSSSNNVAISLQESSIENIEKQIANATVTSPADGTVTQISVKEGETYLAGSIAKVEGLENFVVEAEIDEYDIPDVKLGQQVEIRTDATKEEILKGVVSYTAITATNNSSILGDITGESSLSSLTGSSKTPTYKVDISLEGKNERLRLGMSAKVKIIINEKKNVLSIPFDCIEERDDKTKYITVIEKSIEKDKSGEEKEIEKERQITVTTGIEGTYYTEIISNEIREGMTVKVPSRTSSSSLQQIMDVLGSSTGM